MVASFLILSYFAMIPPCIRSQSTNCVRFEALTAVTMKNTVFWDVSRVAHVRTDFSEELSAPIIRVTRISELGTLAVTSN
jgi:hypothetical protein